VQRLISLGLTLVALLGCTAGSQTVATPVRNASSPIVIMALQDGPIGGQPCDGEAMVGVLTSTSKWLMGLKDETTGVETWVHWPNGFSHTDTDPRGLLNATRAVVAYEGDLISVPGEWAPAGVGAWFACSNVTVL